MSRYIGLCQDSSVTELERRMINRYVIACREASGAAKDHRLGDYLHWHYIAHLRFKALQRVRHSL